MNIRHQFQWERLTVSIEHMSLSERLFMAASLIAVFTFSFPQFALADSTSPLVFEVEEHIVMRQADPLLLPVIEETEDYNALITRYQPLSLEQLTTEEFLPTQEETRRVLILAAYLNSKNSPLADYAHTLAQLPDYKRILGLANAESGLCKRYPEYTANCWGVGGSNLWKMGDNLGEGVISMQNFLENYPKRSDKKYKDWTIDEMNGVYKQPARPHWAYNVNHTIQELEALGL